MAAHICRLTGHHLCDPCWTYCDDAVCLQAVIVDEAAQAVELTCLIPLRHRCPRLVLIGDPMQLPATVISTHAARCGYDRSLFERLTRAGECVFLRVDSVDGE